jgi:hypothetical protein
METLAIFYGDFRLLVRRRDCVGRGEALHMMAGAEGDSEIFN